jgi:hypothetical protein
MGMLTERARETDEIETPACCATSRMVIFLVVSMLVIVPPSQVAPNFQAA